MSKDRARRVRTFARDLSTRTGAEIRATYESGARWYLEWTDGPNVSAVRADTASAELAGAEIRLYRTLSARAIAVGAIRLAAAGEFAIDRRWTIPEHQVHRSLDEVDHPERTADEREERIVDRLVAATTDPARGWASDADICGPVVERGLAWLLDADDGDAGVVLGPRELLTFRYATGAAARAWRERAEPMPIRPAVEAALADPDLDTPGALATLTLLRELRAEQERAEAEAVTAARRANASWTEIGTALGVTKQSAHKWAEKRAAGAPSRASAQG